MADPVVQNEKTLQGDPLAGRTIGGKFRIVSRIGIGAMGAIYRAEQTALGKMVAVKVLHRHLLADPSLSQRFHREARMAARITHPHCITIHDFGSTDDGLLYIAMELIDGRDLAQLVYDEHPLDLRRVIHIAKQACSALDEAHNAGVIHRDLKPENIMVTRVAGDDDFVKVLDFGIAKPRDGGIAGDSFQTMAGVVCGTPEYMSPEQARGEELDARSDLYAMGIVLYYMTTKILPFTGESPLTVVTKHITEQPLPPQARNSALPDAFNALIIQLLSKRREDRPASALALRKKLERIEMTLEHVDDTIPAEETTIVVKPLDGSKRQGVATPTAQATPSAARSPAATSGDAEDDDADCAPTLQVPALSKGASTSPTPKVDIAHPPSRASGRRLTPGQDKPAGRDPVFDTIPDPEPDDTGEKTVIVTHRVAGRSRLQATPPRSTHGPSLELQAASDDRTVLFVESKTAAHLLDTMPDPAPQSFRRKAIALGIAVVVLGGAAWATYAYVF